MTRAFSARGLALSSCVSVLATCVLAPAAFAAQGDEDELDKLIEQEVDSLGDAGSADPAVERPRTFPWVEHHGYFRFRADFFHNPHLDTVVPGDADSGTSAVQPPLTENAVNNDENTPGAVGSQDAVVIAYANMRLRYAPTLHIAEDLRVRTTLDILDNLVLGSTPDFAGDLSRADVPLSAFTRAQASPSAGINGFSDAVRVKEAYGEWQPAFLLRVGRQASHWGLGVLENAGRGVNDDFGDYTDRAMLMFRAWDVYVMAAWDYVYSGAITDDPTFAYGQPKDLGQADDVSQWTLSISQRPVSQADHDMRRAKLYERFEPAFDWGLYGVIRTQDYDLDADSFDLDRSQGGARSADQLALVSRDAFTVVGDLWLRFEQRFDFLTGFRAELEALVISGSVDNINVETGLPESPRDIMQWGVAFESEFQYGNLSVGLDAGAASGDSQGGFGAYGQHHLGDASNPNRTLSAFAFDRDYKIDLLMFREVIGAVTNAWYAKPYVQYDLFDEPDESLGFRVDLLTAGALEPEATPGNAGFYGFEGDVRLFFHNSDGLMLDLEAGFLLPGDAFDYRPLDSTEARDASFAFLLRTRLTMTF